MYVFPSICIVYFFNFLKQRHNFLSTYLLIPWLIRFIAWNFILFYVIISGIVLSISLSDSLFLLFRNGTDFCMLIFFIYNFSKFTDDSSRLLLGSLEFWTARRSNQFILKEISPEYSVEGLMLKLKLKYFGHLNRRTDSFEKT